MKQQSLPLTYAKGKCPLCGAKTVKYRHSLNAGLVRGLLKFKDAGPPINLKDVQGLTRNEWDNFQKLKYWGLVSQYVGTDGKHKGGIWSITEKGIEFTNGTKIRKQVITYRGDVIEYEGPLVDIHDVLIDIQYKQRNEYAIDSEPSK